MTGNLAAIERFKLDAGARACAEGVLRALGFLVFGLVVGYLAWFNENGLFLLLWLPLAANCARRRGEVFALMFGYFLAGDAVLPAIIGRFFEHPSPFATFGAPLALTVILAAPFLLYAPTARRPWVRIATYFAALAVFSLPPIGFLAWRSPLMLAGTFYPGAGLAGVFATGGLLAGLAGLKGKPDLRLALLVALMGGAALTVAHHGKAPTGWGPFLDFAAGDTNLPPATTPRKQTLRTQKVAADIAAASAMPWPKVIILPESVINPYRPVDELLLLPVSDAAKARGQALVFGAILARGENSWRDVVMGAGTLADAQGRPRVLTESRIPMPMGNWHLGFPGGVIAHPFASDGGELAGQPIAWSICYEDTILWPHWRLLTGHAKALISLDNDWALWGTSAARTQAISAKQLARMAGVPLVQARNH